MSETAVTEKNIERIADALEVLVLFRLADKWGVATDGRVDEWRMEILRRG